MAVVPDFVMERDGNWYRIRDARRHIINVNLW